MKRRVLVLLVILTVFCAFQVGYLVGKAAPHVYVVP